MAQISNRLFYKKSFQEFGVSAQGVHWSSKESQYRRFEAICRCLDTLEFESVVDAGCGFGEFYAYLQVYANYASCYMGIDCEAHMIQVCHDRFEKEKFHKLNILYDPLIKADVYVCSGAMNLMDLVQVEIFVSRCFEYANKGFVFNFLKSLSYNQITQDEIFNLCEKYTSNIYIVDDYLENDYTVLMKKDLE
ncbi:MAG: class I SAM-dependent methyltransferase [Campylobacterales bacterium]|nr:class I SAM-dependent methyltransferase [Campylobacterales bacterium]